MKKIDWKILILTCVVCLLPMIAGVFVYDEMPDMVAIHFNIHNEPDNFASKEVALFGLPLLMIALQIFCCVISDMAENQKGNKPKFITVTKWVIPSLALVVSTLTIQIGLGKNVDIRKIVMGFLGILYILMGNYMPKMSYDQMKRTRIRPMPRNEKMYKKMIRTMGYIFVIFGFLFIGSTFFKEMVSVVIMLMFVATAIIISIWMTIKARKED